MSLIYNNPDPKNKKENSKPNRDENTSEEEIFPDPPRLDTSNVKADFNKNKNHKSDNDS